MFDSSYEPGSSQLNESYEIIIRFYLINCTGKYGYELYDSYTERIKNHCGENSAEMEAWMRLLHNVE